MARLILDTSALVADERGDRDAALGAIGDADDVAIAALTLAELRVGVLLATDERRESRAAFVERVARVFVIEDYTEAVASAHGDLLAHVHRAGRPRGAHDLIIAATAIATDRILVTSDRRGFADLPGLTLAS